MALAHHDAMDVWWGQYHLASPKAKGVKRCGYAEKTLSEFRALVEQRLNDTHQAYLATAPLSYQGKRLRQLPIIKNLCVDERPGSWSRLIPEDPLVEWGAILEDFDFEYRDTVSPVTIAEMDFICPFALLDQYMVSCVYQARYNYRVYKESLRFHWGPNIPLTAEEIAAPVTARKHPPLTDDMRRYTGESEREFQIRIELAKEYYINNKVLAAVISDEQLRASAPGNWMASQWPGPTTRLESTFEQKGRFC